MENKSGEKKELNHIDPHSLGVQGKVLAPVAAGQQSLSTWETR